LQSFQQALYDRIVAVIPIKNLLFYFHCLFQKICNDVKITTEKIYLSRERFCGSWDGISSNCIRTISMYESENHWENYVLRRESNGRRRREGEREASIGSLTRVHLHRRCTYRLCRGRGVRVGRSRRRPRGLFVTLCVEPWDRREPLITDAESISISRGFTTCDAGRSRRPRASPRDYLAKRTSLAALPRTRAPCAFIQSEQCIWHARARLDPVLIIVICISRLIIENNR